METAQAALWVVVLLVALALAFDFMNGFHDAANSIATVVSTGVLKPTQAVLFAAFFNFIAIFVFHLSVAATVGKGIVLPAWWTPTWCSARWSAPSPGTCLPGTTASPAVRRTR
jgi:phosphate/sulfate permease